MPLRPDTVGTRRSGGPDIFGSEVDRGRPGRQHSSITARGLTLGPGWSGPSDGQRDGRTDRRTGRAGVRNRAERRAEPGLLNPELGSDKGWSGGRGRGRAGRGQSWAGPGRPLPPQRRSQTLCEWRGPEGAGGRGRGAAVGPMGTWSARPELPGLEGLGRAGGAQGARKRSPRQMKAQGGEPRPKSGTQTDSGRKRDARRWAKR